MSHVPVTALRIRAWNRPVGGAVLSARPPYVVFQYDPAWLRDGPQLAPLLMPHRDGDRLHSFRQLDPTTFRGLPPLLADALPDAFGNRLTDEYLADQGILPHELTGLDRLAYVGDRGLGALTFEPDQGSDSARPTSLDLAELVAAARDVVTGDLNDTPGRRLAVRHLQGIGTSAGGAQAKALVGWNRATGAIRAGQGGTDDFEPWLLKFDLGEAPGLPAGPTGAGRIEYAYHLMAAKAGIELPEAHLVEESGRAHFLVRRFDRDAAGERLHQQSLGALGGLDFTLIATHSATQLFRVADAIGLDDAARHQLLRRVAFNVLAGNRDDHPKNHAFLMDRSGRWSLAPAYDLTFAYDLSNPWLARHHLAVEGKFDGITRRDLRTLADRCDVPDWTTALEAVQAAVADWPASAIDAGVDPPTTKAIGDRLATIRRAWSAR